MFTIAQTQHIENVQSILGFPLNRPYQHLSAQMQDWHYTEFQTALTVAWLITGRGRDDASETAASLRAISDRLNQSEEFLFDQQKIFGELELLSLDHYHSLMTPTEWQPLGIKDGGSSLPNSKAFSQLAQTLHDAEFDKNPDKPHVPSPFISPFKIR
ncbi:hypothetical protein VDG03_19405 [Xanthomonas campestris pv. raphani]|uniref:hypothetical protein n=1 Tax=Xanthomonas TaxID=338 RepID=UPI001C449060|nr:MULTISPECIES: hypothetical protein [Xanthomonas]MBV6690057.1 hypothetical protein [Xanthomonas euvesicatoria pv. physalidis]MEA9753141.1 hypothetical protein [Xanthomonas campestris pv. raphani]MEA9813340.1 hypothetical protein [Xanthomonas campestris pv. raphani]